MKAHEYSFCPECGNKLEGDEFLCPSCGFRLVNEPVQQSPVEQTPPPMEEFVPPVAPPIQEMPPVVTPQEPVVPPVQEVVPPVQQTVQPQVQQPIQNPYGQDMFVQQAAAPARKKKRIGLKIFITLLILIIVGGGVSVLLLSQGIIPRETVEGIIPAEILDPIAPAPAPVVSSEPKVQKVFYIVHSATLIEDKKVAMVSNTIEPSSYKGASEDGAKTAFLKFARIKYSDDYFQFKNIFVRTFNEYDAAAKERDKIKKDYTNKGYELRLLEVVYTN